jgi:thiamine biosynthesis lipoprotein
MSPSVTAVSFPALGSTAVLAVAQPEGLPAARAEVERVIAEFDLACSRFRDDSELMALNAAAGSAVVVSPLLLAAVTAALRAAQLTGGDVDPTIGQALIALGYDRDFDQLPDARGDGGSDSPRSIAAVPGWRTVRIDRERSTIKLSRGVSLDLGATAKALCADQAAAAAHLAAGCGVLVSLGGDMAIAGPPPADGWRVRVTDDHRSGTDAPGQWISLRSGLATSSTTARRWHHGGQDLHHVIDPSTSAPVDPVWRTVSVTAESCLDANIASTAAIVRGEPAVQWLEAIGLPSRLVRVDGSVLHLAGWPQDGDDLTVSGRAPATADVAVPAVAGEGRG